MKVAEIKGLEDEALREPGRQASEELESLRVKYLGRKGALTLILRGLEGLARTSDAWWGRRPTGPKRPWKTPWPRPLAALKDAARRDAAPPSTSPCRAAARPWGRLHPITQVMAGGLRHLPAPGL